MTAGASAPDVLVDDVIEALRAFGPVEIATLDGIQEENPVPAAVRSWWTLEPGANKGHLQPNRTGSPAWEFLSIKSSRSAPMSSAST